MRVCACVALFQFSISANNVGVNVGDVKYFEGGDKPDRVLRGKKVGTVVVVRRGGVGWGRLKPLFHFSLPPTRFSGPSFSE